MREWQGEGLTLATIAARLNEKAINRNQGRKRVVVRFES